jgi:hypothetical protein
MEIKINSHPGGVPETGEASMGSTYYSNGGAYIKSEIRSTKSETILNQE